MVVSMKLPILAKSESEQKRADQLLSNRKAKLRVLFDLCQEAAWLEARAQDNGLVIENLTSHDCFTIAIGDSFSILEILEFLGLLKIPEN